MAVTQLLPPLRFRNRETEAHFFFASIAKLQASPLQRQNVLQKRRVFWPAVFFSYVMTHRLTVLSLSVAPFFGNGIILDLFFCLHECYPSWSTFFSDVRWRYHGKNVLLLLLHSSQLAAQKQGRQRTMGSVRSCMECVHLPKPAEKKLFEARISRRRRLHVWPSRHEQKRDRGKSSFEVKSCLSSEGGFTGARFRFQDFGRLTKWNYAEKKISRVFRDFVLHSASICHPISLMQVGLLWKKMDTHCCLRRQRLHTKRRKHLLSPKIRRLTLRRRTKIWRRRRSP